MKTKKSSLSLILAVLLMFVFAMSASAAPTQNDDGFYELATADDMVWFRDQVAAGNTTINAVLMDNIDLTNIVWKPIWNESQFITDNPKDFNFTASEDSDMPYWYGGMFDGNGKTITLDTFNNSLYYFPPNPRDPNPIQAGGGLFMGTSDTAVIKNLTLCGKMILAGFPNIANTRVFAAPVVTKNRGTLYNISVENFTIENSGLSSTSVLASVSAFSFGNSAVIDGCRVENNMIYSMGQKAYTSLLVGQAAYNSSVKNSVVLNSTIKNSSGGTVAGIASECFEGASITNCSVSGVGLEATITSIAGYSSYVGGITGYLRSGTDTTVTPFAASILNCSVTDSTLTATTADANALPTNAYVGGIAGYSYGSTTGVPTLIQNCVVLNVTSEASGTNSVYSGGIVGPAFGVQILQCVVENSDQTAWHKGAYVVGTNRPVEVGGIAGYFTLRTTSTKENEGKILECVVNGLSITAGTESSTAAANYRIGAIAGHVLTDAVTTSGDLLIQHCAAIGTISFDVDTNNSSGKNSTAHLGGFVGRNYGKVYENSLGDFTVASADTQGATTWYIGTLAGELGGRNADVLRGELVDNLYDGDISITKLVGTPAAPNTDPSHATALLLVSGNETFDASDLDDAATLFVSFFKGGEVELAAGQTLDLELEAFAGTLGINLSAASWSSSDPNVLTVSPATGANVTISALAPGTATLTCTYTLNGEERTSTLTIVVPETPEYAKDNTGAVITGTPEDGTIFPGEDVNLTYDFSPYIAIGVDNTGMQTDISGLIADILDGKVVVTGVAKESGTYYYVVTLQGANGEIRTQRVLVTVQGGSRPTGNGSGGGSSNCNTGVGAALFALFGLALIQKRK